MIHLDSDTAIEILRMNKVVSERFERAMERVAISTVVLAELLFGIEKSRNPASGKAEIKRLLANIDLVPFGVDCATHAAAQPAGQSWTHVAQG